MTIKTLNERIQNDTNFTNSIKTNNNKKYILKQDENSNGIENLYFTEYYIYNIKLVKKDDELLEKRASAYFNGSGRKFSDYEAFINNGKISLILFDDLEDSRKNDFARKIKDNALYENLTKDDQDKAKVKYYKSFASEFANKCFNYFGECQINCDPKDDIWHHYDKTSEKKAICLHYTASPSTSVDFSTLLSKFREGVHYVIGRDGSIFRLFDDKYYSGHLGSFNASAQSKINARLNDFMSRTGDRKAKSSDNLHNQSISIEISNLGYLVETEKKYDNEEKFKLKHKYRGHDAYESLSDKQMDAVCYLIYYLMQKHPTIPNKWQVDNYDDDQADDYSNMFSKNQKDRSKFRQEYYDFGAKFYTLNEANLFEGIFTHTDYRFGKEDFPSEIIKKIRSRFREIYNQEEDKKCLATHYYMRFKELQEKKYTDEEILQIVGKESQTKTSTFIDEFLYTDPDLNSSLDQ